MINDNNAQIRHPNNNDIIDKSDEQHQLDGRLNVL